MSATTRARRWWLVHQWAGLKLAILLSFTLLTGTLAVLSQEIDWLLRPAMRVDPATVEAGIDWAAMAKSVALHYPAERLASLQAPTDPWFAATATIVSTDTGGETRRRFVYLHPATGVVQGDGSWITAQRILRQLHRHLMLPVKIGVPIVSSLALLLLVSLVTALVVYKRWWSGFFKPVRSTNARMLWGDLHRLAGVWSLWFVVLMILTGLWYLVESLVAPAPAHPAADIAPLTATPAEIAAHLPASLAAARVAYPRLRIEYIRLPTDDSGAFVFQGQDRALLVRPRANSVWTEAHGATVKLIADATDLSVHQRIAEMADPLHFGTLGGLPTRLVWFAFGLALTALSVSGVAIYAIRLLRREHSGVGTTAVMTTAWHGMGAWRWPATALVVAALALLPTL